MDVYEENSGQLSLFEEQVPEFHPKADDDLKKAIENTMEKIRIQAMLLGGQTMLRVILGKITAAQNQPGKRTMNDYKRLIKDIEQFCNVGLSRQVNADGEAETVQN